MKTRELGIGAVRKAKARGYTTYELAGTTELLEAKRQGWLKRDKRYTEQRYKVTPEGLIALDRHIAKELARATAIVMEFCPACGVPLNEGCDCAPIGGRP